MDVYIWLYFYYYIVYLFAIFTNLLLIYAIYKVGNFCAKPCLVVLLNQTLGDFIICTVLVLLVPRRIPVGNSIVVFSYGLCGLIHPYTCEVLNMLWLVFLAQNIMAMTLSFFYRYYVLYHQMITTKYAFLICLIPYIIGAPFFYLGQSNTVTGNDLGKLTAPYNISIPSGTVNFGYQDYLSTKLIVVHVYAFYLTPIWCIVMFFFRYKVIVYLDKGWALSPQTLEKHRALVKVLTVQSCLPMLHLLNIILYYLEQSQILQISDFDLTFLMSIHLIAAIGGVISLYILKPYRQQALLLFKRLTSNGSSTKTEILSNSLPPVKSPGLK